MPRENIISGGLEGGGVEGHKKRVREKPSLSDSSDEFQSKERKEEIGDPFDTGFGSARQEPKIAAEKSVKKMNDIFETDFGSARSKKEYHADSSIGSDSDIFSNGFGSKDAGWMSGRGRKSAGDSPDLRSEIKKEPVVGKKETADIFETAIASHPLETSETAGNQAVHTVSPEKKKTESKDPFYTGFGYTDQRDQKTASSASSGTPVAKKELQSKKPEEKGKKRFYDEEDDDLFS